MLTSSCYFKGAVASSAALQNIVGKIISIGVCAIENWCEKEKVPEILFMFKLVSWICQTDKQKIAWYESGAIHWLWTKYLFFIPNFAITNSLLYYIMLHHILIHRKFSLKIRYWAFFSWHTRHSYYKYWFCQKITFTFTFSHLADAFIQSDLQLGST